MVEGEAILGSCRSDFGVELTRPLPAPEFPCPILAPVQAACRHGWIELERPPGHCDRNIARNERERLFKAAFADVAPRADDVRDYLKEKAAAGGSQGRVPSTRQFVWLAPVHATHRLNQ